MNTTDIFLDKKKRWIISQTYSCNLLTPLSHRYGEILVYYHNHGFRINVARHSKVLNQNKLSFLPSDQRFWALSTLTTSLIFRASCSFLILNYMLQMTKPLQTLPTIINFFDMFFWDARLAVKPLWVYKNITYHFQACRVPLAAMLPYHFIIIPPWTVERLPIIFNLHQITKQSTPAIIYNTRFLEIF